MSLHKSLIPAFQRLNRIIKRSVHQFLKVGKQVRPVFQKIHIYWFLRTHGRFWRVKLLSSVREEDTGAAGRAPYSVCQEGSHNTLLTARVWQCNKTTLLNAGSGVSCKVKHQVGIETGQRTWEKAQDWSRKRPPPSAPWSCRLMGPGPAGGTRPPLLGPTARERRPVMPGPTPHERRLGDARPHSPGTPPRGCPALLASPTHHERRLRDAERAALPSRRRLVASGRRHLGTDSACAACARPVRHHVSAVRHYVDAERNARRGERWQPRAPLAREDEKGKALAGTISLT